MRNFMFPSSRAQWARTLALLLGVLAIFLVAQDWTWFFVEGALALIYIIIFCARFVPVASIPTRLFMPGLRRRR